MLELCPIGHNFHNDDGTDKYLQLVHEKSIQLVVELWSKHMIKSICTFTKIISYKHFVFLSANSVVPKVNLIMATKQTAMLLLTI